MIIFLRYGEVYLKSKRVKNEFLNVLKRNVKSALKEYGLRAMVKKEIGQFVLYCEKNIVDILKHVFGISSIIVPKIVEIDEKSIADVVINEYLKNEKTFAVRTKRINKKLPCTSQEFNRVIGEIISKKGYRVDLSNPDVVIHVELKDKAYIYTKSEKGAGGLPLGVSGVAASSIKNKKDCVACWLMMKRGFTISSNNNTEYTRILKRWHLGQEIYLRGFDVIIDSENSMKKILSKPKNVFYPLAGFCEKEIDELFFKIIK